MPSSGASTTAPPQAAPCRGLGPRGLEREPSRGRTAGRLRSGGHLSVPRVTLEDVQVTEADLARIPRRNVRVPVAEFAQVWVEAGRRTAHQDWYAAGVAMTCRWMAHGVIELNGRRVPADAPVSHRSSRAYEELIEAELLAAEKLALQRPVPAWLAQRPGWCEAVCATLRWAWRRNGPPPLRVPTPG